MGDSADVRDAVEAAGLGPEVAERRVRVSCPLCADGGGRDRNLTVELRQGFWKCFRCGKRGRMPDWGDVIPDDLLEPRASAGELPERPRPPGWAPLWDPAVARSLSARPALAYARRRVPEHLWRELDLGATLTGSRPEVGRLVVPVLDDRGRWLGWVGRAWDPRSRLPHYTDPGLQKSRALFNGRALRAPSAEPVLVCEGVFDAVHLWPDGVAVLGKPSLYQMAMLAACPRPVVWCMDGDTTSEDGTGEADGWADRLRIMRACEGTGQTGIVRLPPATDPDEVPADEIRATARASLR